MSGAHRTDSAEYLARVARVAPAIDAAAEKIEDDRRLPADLLAALHKEKLFRLLLPKPFGGEEIDLPTFFLVLNAIAEHDASTAWCICQTNGCATSAAFLDADVAQAVWGDDPNAALSWGPGVGKVAEKDGGYVVNGRWQFASGSRLATWLGGNSLVTLNGKETLRTLLFPASQAEMIDIWNVIGLRGTASDGYAVKDLFVPKNYAVTRGSERAELRYEAPAYFIPAHNWYGTGFSGVALGIARAALDLFKQRATEKKPHRLTKLLCEDPVVQADLAVAEARLGSAKAFMLQEANAVWGDVVKRGEFILADRMRIRLAATYAIHEAKEVVNMAYDAAGATVIFKGHPIERRFRDIHTLTQQSQGRKNHFQNVGAFMLGLEPDLPSPY
ncbi:MAG: acyl-CoA dehydrogenase family protein [Rhodospirillales bacterium]